MKRSGQRPERSALTGSRAARAALSLLAFSLVGAVAPARPVPTGTQVLQSMHDRYAGRWFKTLTFVQTTTRPKPGGGDTSQTWYESASLPGRLRIDVGAPSLGNGVLYTHDSTYRIEKGAVKQTAAEGNPLIPLLFDVYVVPVERTVADVRQTLKIDLSKVHEATWDGRKVYVIGADDGDEKSPQVWIDVDRLVVLRQFFTSGPGDSTVVDTRLSDYRPIAKSWIAPKCEFFVKGKSVQREQYNDIKADVALSPALFDPAAWTTAPHWAH